MRRFYSLAAALLGILASTTVYSVAAGPTSIVYETNNSVTATETMTWDKESRMLTNSLANASYVYNGFDTRVSKTVSSTTTTFKRAGADPVSPVVSDVVGGSTTTNYLPGISSRTGGTSTFSHCGIKNGVLQTNSSQSNTATKRCDAFGDNPTGTGTWQTRFNYGGGLGYQRDDESDYKLLGHRYYDPEIGRFLTRDPIKDGRNWYTYCDNSPLAFVDRDGKAYASCAPDAHTVLYKLVNSTTGELYKWGITSQHPMFRRYTKLFYQVMGLKMIDVMSGPRHRMLRAERLFIKFFPGPGNKEIWRGPPGRPGGFGGRGLGIVMAVPTAVDVATDLSITGARHASRYKAHLDAIDDPSLERRASALEGVDEEHLPD